MAGRIDFAGQRTYGCGSTGLTGQAHVKYCGNIINPRQFHWRTGDKHNHDRLASTLQRLNQIVLHLRNRHGGTVKTFGFATLIKTDDRKHHIHIILTGQGYGVFHEHVIRLALTVVALLVTGKH